MKKKLLAFLAFAVTAFSAAALPGVKPYIKDKSGEYVYYRDKSFTRESYIGFLTYDELTYAARYFAPATEELPPKNIEFLFTLDPSKSYIDLSGERFLTPVAQEDTEIVNYIHDLIFEFGKRRQNAGEISPRAAQDSSVNPSVTYVDATVLLNSGFRSKEEMYQFGGDVNIYYDYYVPIFNIKKIETVTDSVFEVVAIGSLKSSDDKSFDNFMPSVYADNVTHKAKGKAKSKTYDFGTSSITLDENWEQAGQVENLLFYGDSAMVTAGTINSWELDLYIKTCLLSAQEAYLPWNKISIIKSPKQITVYSTAYTGSTSNKKINSFITQSSKLQKGKNAVLTMVILESDYESYKKYFTNIFKSWK